MLSLRRLARGMGCVAVVAAMGLTTACEKNGGDGDKSSGGSVVGQWAAVNQADQGKTWWKFNADGTFAMYDDGAFARRHLGGTFSQDGKSVKGPFTNPRVGEGEIDATISDDGKALQIDFIEHWHSPYKHVPISATKM